MYQPRGKHTGLFVFPEVIGSNPTLVFVFVQPKLFITSKHSNKMKPHTRNTRTMNVLITKLRDLERSCVQKRSPLKSPSGCITKQLTNLEEKSTRSVDYFKKHHKENLLAVCSHPAQVMLSLFPLYIFFFANPEMLTLSIHSTLTETYTRNTRIMYIHRKSREVFVSLERAPLTV